MASMSDQVFAGSADKPSYTPYRAYDFLSAEVDSSSLSSGSQELRDLHWQHQTYPCTSVGGNGPLPISDVPTAEYATCSSSVYLSRASVVATEIIFMPQQLLPEPCRYGYCDKCSPFSLLCPSGPSPTLARQTPRCRLGLVVVIVALFLTLAACSWVAFLWLLDENRSWRCTK